MGLSIHYKGRLKDFSLEKELTAEVADICKSMKWKSTLINFQKGKVRGIVFAPKKCEPIYFTFSQDGRLFCPLGMMSGQCEVDKELAEERHYMVHTKTHYAGPDNHIAIIELMRYITDKYFAEFKMYDETYYWETKDKMKMLERFTLHNAALNAVAETLSTIKKIPGESPKSAVARIEKILRERFGGIANY